MKVQEKDKILLIDTDKLLTNELAERLGNVGFDVLTANDTDTALKLTEIVKPSVALMDLSMTTSDGKDIITLFKSERSLSDTPIIILSSDTDADSQVYAFLNGASDYITKPFKFPEVLARVNNQIRLHKKQKELEEQNMELVKKNSLLEQMAITDSLTGFYNKGYVLKRIGSEILRSARYGEVISLIIIDVDHFKDINDSHGHIAGDKVLKNLSRHIAGSVRDVDITARYGGEEFIVVCPNTGINGARILAERIRENVQNATFHSGSVNMNITVSLGISSLSPHPPVNIDSSITKLLGEADIAMYRAKSAGRNRVEIYMNKIGAINIEDKEEYKQMFTETSEITNKFAH